MTIRKLLIANRGEIASRVIRTARALDIATVAVFSDPDAGLPFVRDADEAVRLPGSAPAETYLNVEALLAAAAATGADSVHPGYGFLSENAGFARACAAAGLTFVGPDPGGDRGHGVQDRRQGADGRGRGAGAARRGVRRRERPGPGRAGQGGRRDRLPGAGQGGVRRRRPRHADRQPPVRSGRGGGQRPPRGRVRVRRRHGVPGALRRFAPAHRGPDLRRPGGTVVHLFERECSIQRRYQKIIEEAPSPAVDARAARSSCARPRWPRARPSATSARARWSSCWTPAGRFYFLEVNTRLQVEHPVTELVTGLDLVKLQLEVAAGEPLPPEVTGATHHRARDRGPAVRRGRARRATCRPAGTSTRSTFPPRPRASGSTPASPPAPGSARSTTRCWPRSSGTAGPATTPAGCWPARWPGPGCTASSPTGTCWSGSCASRSSGPGPSTPVT